MFIPKEYGDALYYAHLSVSEIIKEVTEYIRWSEVFDYEISWGEMSLLHEIIHDADCAKEQIEFVVESNQ